MDENEVQVKTEFVLQTRRKYMNLTSDEYTPWRAVYSSINSNDVIAEKKAHRDGGYKSELLQIVRRITIEDVWDR